MADEDRQRIDKWLWFTRVVKTRPLAQKLAASGHVRLNGRRIDGAAQAVRIGDVLTIGLNERVLVYRVLGFAERRVAYPVARTLYEDLAPQPAQAGEHPASEAGGTETDDAGILSTEADDAGATAAETASASPHAATGEPRRIRGEGRPTKRDRRRLDRGLDRD